MQNLLYYYFSSTAPERKVLASLFCVLCVSVCIGLVYFETWCLVVQTGLDLAMLLRMTLKFGSLAFTS